ncbi:hypothetical protein D3C76_1717780 [compost metagenome]
MHPAESHGSADAQVAGQSAGCPASSVVGLVGFFEGAFGPLEKRQPGLGGRQAAC